MVAKSLNKAVALATATMLSVLAVPPESLSLPVSSLLSMTALLQTLEMRLLVCLHILTSLVGNRACHADTIGSSVDESAPKNEVTTNEMSRVVSDTSKMSIISSMLC
jgi:hypothetical protein